MKKPNNQPQFFRIFRNGVQFPKTQIIIYFSTARKMAVLVGLGIAAGASLLGYYVFGSKLEKVGKEYEEKEDQHKHILLPEDTPQSEKDDIRENAKNKLGLDGVSQISV